LFKESKEIEQSKKSTMTF